MTTNEIDRLTSRGVHNGVVADVDAGTYADFHDALAEEKTKFVLILDGITDPQNFGAILRVADGFGVDLVVIPEHESVGLTRGEAPLQRRDRAAEVGAGLERGVECTAPPILPHQRVRPVLATLDRQAVGVEHLRARRGRGRSGGRRRQHRRRRDRLAWRSVPLTGGGGEGCRSWGAASAKADCCTGACASANAECGCGGCGCDSARGDG